MTVQTYLRVCTLVFLLVGIEPHSKILAADAIGIVQLEVFVRGDMPSAGKVANYLDDLQQRVQGIEVLTRDVTQDREQLKRLYELTRKAGRSKPVVPAFHCCERMYFGFDDTANSRSSVEALFTAEVYTRSTCPRCTDAKRFIADLKKRWPAIQFRIYEVSTDNIARQRWESLCRGSGSAPGLPTFDFAGHVIIGYQGDEITGKALESLIERKSRVAPRIREQPAPINSGSWFLLSPSHAVLGLLQTPSTQQPEVETDQSDPWELPDEATESEMGEAVLPSESPGAQEVQEAIDIPVFGRISVNDLGMPLFSFLVGLVDGFNPCAMWILVFLLSVLVNIKDRKKIVVIAGTFVLVSGMAYYAFMAAWLNLFLLIGIARPIQIALGLLALFIGVINVKDFFAFKKGLTFSIPEGQKPGLYRRVRSIVEAKYLTVALGGAVALAIIVNMVELLCTAGLPALYTQILMLQELPQWQNYVYLGVYIVAYMLDDTLLVTAVVITLSHRKLQEREGRWLKLLSGIVILVLGTVMLLRPELLQLGH